MGAMTMVSSTALVEMLRRSRLLEPAQLDQLVQTLPDLPGGGQPFGEALVRRGWLTPFQAKRLLEGLATELVVGEYLILERVGRGQVADVSRARHRRQGHEVALKVIRPDHRGDLQVMQRFRREVEALGQLSHPNIIGALDLEEIGTAHYYAMEYVAGLNLDQLIEQVGRLPVGPACDYTRQAALALQHAHDHALIHRDVKPANLLLAPPRMSAISRTIRQGRWGTVKLLDLGLARLQREEPNDRGVMGLTEHGFMLGTVDYMAPEQVTSAHAVDSRADVYALGCCAYHMLTGQPPFADGEMIDKLNRHLCHEPPRMEELRPEVPPALAGVVRKMMAKTPEGRYQTAREVADVLETILGRLDESRLALDWKLPGRKPKHAAPGGAQADREERSNSLSTVLLVLLLFIGSYAVYWFVFAR